MMGTDDGVSAEDLACVQVVGNAITQMVAAALHEAEEGIREGVACSTDRVVLAGCINGAVAGVMQFVHDMAEEGRLANPDARVELMFKLAADIWTQIRGGPAGTAGAVQ